MKKLNQEEENKIKKLNEELNQRLQIDSPEAEGDDMTYQKKKKDSSSREIVKKKKKKVKTRDMVLRFFQISFVVLLSMVFILSGTLVFMIRHGKAELMKEKEVSAEMSTQAVEAMEDGLISYGGHRYRPRTNLINILLLGIDQEELQSENKVPGEHVISPQSSRQGKYLK